MSQLQLDAVELGVISIELDGQDIDLDLQSILPVDEDSLSREFANQASLYAYIAMLSARAEAMNLDARDTKDRIYAQMDKRARLSLKERRESFTEAKVKAVVLTSVDYQDACDYLISCRETMLMLKSLVTAMEQRASMLQSLGAHVRHEAEQTGMIIRDARAKLEATRKV